MNIKQILRSVIGPKKVQSSNDKLQKQIHKLELEQCMTKTINDDKRNFRYPYSEELPPVIISEKAQNAIDELKKAMSNVSINTHNKKIKSEEHSNIFFTTKDYPIYDMQIDYDKDKILKITQRDSNNKSTPILTFEITNNKGEQRELIRVSSVDVPECDIKKGQVLKYENRDNYFYKRDPLYPRRNFDTIEQQSAGHPLLLKRINRIILSIFKLKNK